MVILRKRHSFRDGQRRKSGGKQKQARNRDCGKQSREHIARARKNQRGLEWDNVDMVHSLFNRIVRSTFYSLAQITAYEYQSNISSISFISGMAHAESDPLFFIFILFSFFIFAFSFILTFQPFGFWPFLVTFSGAVNVAYVAYTIKGLKCITAHEMRYKGTLKST